MKGFGKHVVNIVPKWKIGVVKQIIFNLPNAY